ncbi:protein NipSnap homolog 3A-like isoform X2 [Diadema antillarum]
MQVIPKLSSSTLWKYPQLKSAGTPTAVSCLRNVHDEVLSQQPAHKKLYEMRTYSIKPASFLDFVNLVNEKIHIRRQHSKLVGFWAAEMGAFNQVVHIWEYESYAARQAVRAAVNADEKWQTEVMSKVRPMLNVMDLVALKLLPWKPLQDKPFKEGGVYELRQYVMKPGRAEDMKSRILLRDEAYTKLDCGKLIGAFLGEIGHINTLYHLYSWESADKRVMARDAVLEMDAFKNLPVCDALTPQMETKIMLPLPFSPLR